MDLGWGFLLQGMAIGFSIAAPVGPIGVLCIRRTLAGGMKLGLVSGLGAATADAIYGLIAGFGLTAVSTFLIEYQFWFRLIGGLFLCYLAVTTFGAVVVQQEAKVAARNGGLVGAYTSTLLLTVTNPMTILSFAAVFAGLGLGGTASYSNAVLMVGGVFLGSIAWWLTLSGAVQSVREKLNPGWLRLVNQGAGLILGGFGITILMSLV